MEANLPGSVLARAHRLWANCSGPQFPPCAQGVIGLIPHPCCCYHPTPCLGRQCRWLAFFQPSYGISPVPGRDNQVPHHPYLAAKARRSFGNKSERGLCNGAFVQLLLLLKTQNSQVGVDGQVWGAIVCADSPGQLLFF